MMYLGQPRRRRTPVLGQGSAVVTSITQTPGALLYDVLHPSEPAVFTGQATLTPADLQYLAAQPPPTPDLGDRLSSFFASLQSNITTVLWIGGGLLAVYLVGPTLVQLARRK